MISALLTTLTLNSGAIITTQARWNGSLGRVVAIEANGNVVINGTISADGMGFRGGGVTDYSNCCPNGSDSTAFASNRFNQRRRKRRRRNWWWHYCISSAKLGGPHLVVARRLTASR